MIRGKDRMGESMSWEEYVNNRVNEMRRHKMCMRRDEKE